MEHNLVNLEKSSPTVTKLFRAAVSTNSCSIKTWTLYGWNYSSFVRRVTVLLVWRWWTVPRWSLLVCWGCAFVTSTLWLYAPSAWSLSTLQLHRCPPCIMVMGSSVNLYSNRCAQKVIQTTWSRYDNGSFCLFQMFKSVLIYCVCMLHHQRHTALHRPVLQWLGKGCLMKPSRR